MANTSPNVNVNIGGQSYSYEELSNVTPEFRKFRDAWADVEGGVVTLDPVKLHALMSKWVNEERHKRLTNGFSYDFGGDIGVQTADTDEGSHLNILATNVMAFQAISVGAAQGDFRWQDPTADFEWIMSDNTRVPMDAQTAYDWSQKAMMYKKEVIFAANELKKLDPIPDDYANNSYWPSNP